MREEREREGNSREVKRENEGERIGSLSNKLWLSIKRLQHLLPSFLLSHFRNIERENIQEREEKNIEREREREAEEGRKRKKQGKLRNILAYTKVKLCLYASFSHILFLKKQP